MNVEIGPREGKGLKGKENRDGKERVMHVT